MTYLLLQTFLLLLSAYFLGAFVACLLRRWLQPDGAYQTVPAYREAYREPLPEMPRPMPPQRLGPAVDERAPRPAPVIARPRVIDPVQPRIEVVPRPAPRPIPKITDTTRFERALFGPALNEGMPRVSVVEVCPAVLPMVTGPAAPWPPPRPPEPVIIDELGDGEAFVIPKPVAERAGGKPVPARPYGMASGMGGAMASAAAAAIMAAKAAAETIQPPPRDEPPAPPVDETDDYDEASAAESADAPTEQRTEQRDWRTSTAARDDDRDDDDRDDDDRDGDDISKEETAAAPSSYARRDETDDRNTPFAPDDENAATGAQDLAEPTAPPVFEPITDGDDLQRIRAIDAATEQTLKRLAVLRFDDIARWVSADVDRVDRTLNLAGRIDREQWIEQAQILAKGGETYYSRNRARAVGTPEPSAAPSPSSAATLAPVAVSSVPSTPAAQTPTPTPSVFSRTLTPAPEPQPAAPKAGTPQRSVAELAAAAAAAIAAASASVTRGIRPIEPISPLSKADPSRTSPARLSDALRAQPTPRAPDPEAEATVAPSDPDAVDDPDGEDLKRIRGIGVLIEKRLNALGITRYAQIANWTGGDIDRISQTLDFKGRIERENWIEQARILSSGGQTEFSRRVDRGDVESSRDS